MRYAIQRSYRSHKPIEQDTYAPLFENTLCNRLENEVCRADDHPLYTQVFRLVRTTAWRHLR